MLTEEQKQEMEAILRDWLEEEKDAAYVVMDALQSIDATPTQIRKYLQDIQSNYTEIAQDAEKEGNPEDAADFHNKAAQVAKLIAKLR